MKRQKYYYFMCGIVAILAIALGIGAWLLGDFLDVDILVEIAKYIISFAIFIWIVELLIFFIRNKIYKGFRYSLNYILVKNKLEKQLVEAGIYAEKEKYIEVPKIKLEFDKSLETGILMIKNSIRFDKRLDDMILCAGLRKYKVENHYKSDDANWYIYEMVKGSASFKLDFETFDEFKLFNSAVGSYEMFLDKRSIVQLSSMLIVGQTGSGKSYSLYSLLLQGLNKGVDYNFYFADPKGSSISIIGKSLDKRNTAVYIDDIINSLRKFNQSMEERKIEMEKLLAKNIEADYSYFGFEPYIFVFDEYAAFATALALYDKKTRDEVKKILYNIVLLGRQLGYFIWIVAQKADSTIIDTSLRENLPIKICLGQSERQTYITCFGNGVEIPNRRFKTGEGVFTAPMIANTPTLVQFPYYHFNILDYIKRGVRS